MVANSTINRSRRVGQEGSIYPEHPPGSRILVRVSGSDLNALDRVLVVCSSLFVVGSVAWVPMAYAWLWRRWSKIPKEHKRRRTWCAALLLALPAFAAIAPHRHKRFGRWFKLRSWGVWKSWLRFVAFEVVADSANQVLDLQSQRSVLTVIPHGIFPFALGLAAISETAAKVFGPFRPVVATATSIVPFLGTLLSWLNSVDASRSAVDKALSEKDKGIGLAPGGIQEMFVGYPKPGTHPDEEYAILKNRKGFVRMAIKYGLPIVPVYCFGATKMFKRLQISFLEQLSQAIRVSICIFFGMWGLPVPFRQRLLYVMGQPLYPSPGAQMRQGAALEKEVDDLHERFCEEILHLFEKHKHSYGWDHKILKIV